MKEKPRAVLLFPSEPIRILEKTQEEIMVQRKQVREDKINRLRKQILDQAEKNAHRYDDEGP